jgi:hypothetical protein
MIMQIRTYGIAGRLSNKLNSALGCCFVGSVRPPGTPVLETSPVKRVVMPPNGQAERGQAAFTSRACHGPREALLGVPEFFRGYHGWIPSSQAT